MWNPNSESDLAGYKLYYGFSSRNYDSSVDVGNQTSYTLTGLVSGVTYYIAATAYDFSGNESNYSAEISYNVPDTTLPSTPTNLQATAISVSQIDLSWNASTDNVGVTGYKIYRDGTQITTTANTTFQDTGLSPSTTYTYSVSAYDAAGNESGQSYTTSATTFLLPTNNPPVLSPIGNKSVSEVQTLSFTISATDLDGETLSFTASNLPSGAIFNGSTKTFSWTPTYSQAGTYSNIVFQVSDGKDIDSESITITVVNVNRAPVLDPILNITVNEGVTLTLNPTATDPDGDPLTYTYSGWMTSASYTTNFNDAGTHTVTVTVSDGSLTDSQDVTIMVVNTNRAPVLNQISNITVNEGDTITLNPTATDPDGDPLTYTYSGWMTSASYTTNFTDAGTHTVTVTVSDGSLTDSQDVMITVIDVDIISPSTPTSLQATVVSTSQIDLSWNASTDNVGVTGYRIYRDGVQIANVTSTSYQDTGLGPSTTYIYTVSAYDSAGNESAQSNQATATTSEFDTTPPTVISVSAGGVSTQIVVVFSEPVELSSATNISNYNVNNGITVSSASLGSDLKTVTLTTSPHTEGLSYTLIINNVKDRASIPNVIAPNTTENYTFIAQLIISNLTVASGKPYEVVQSGIHNGELVYIDRTYTYSNVPTLIEGAIYIKTANGDKASTSSSFITFEVNQDVTVYIAHDDRITTKPSWMTSFTDTGDDLVIAARTHSIWKKDFTTSTITLGGNEGGGNSMYTVIIVGQGTGSAPDTTPPTPPQGIVLTVQ
ncbi:MAG: fibronectin type III domain-containing protein [Candidatus Scalinduaceae bacterium]